MVSYQDDIKKLMGLHPRRLHKLKETSAIHGLSVSPKILIEIEGIEAEIEKLTSELELIEKETLSQYLHNLKTENQVLKNLISTDLNTVDSTFQTNFVEQTDKMLGEGIKIGGLYLDVQFRVAAGGWVRFGKGWVKSGWLYTPQRSCHCAEVFFKVHLLNDGRGYVHILSSANPIHTIWFETATGCRYEEKFCWSEDDKVSRTALWKFTWK